MAGRPKYEPTITDRVTVRMLVALGASHEQIARCLGDGVRIFGISDRTLRKHFRWELDHGFTDVQTTAMMRLTAAIEAGESWAVKFFLERRGGMAETHRFVDGKGNDRGLSLMDIDASIDAYDKAEAAKAAHG